MVYFALGCAPYSGFFRDFVVAFLAFFTVVFDKTMLLVPILLVIHLYYTQMVCICLWLLHVHTQIIYIGH